MNRKPKAAYVAIQSAVTELAGDEVVLAEGQTRVPAGHPLLRVVPHLFALDTSGGPLREPKVLPPLAQSPYGGAGFRVAEPIPPERRVRARTLVLLDRAVFAFAGDIRDANDPIVKRNPSLFEPAPPPEAA